MAISKWTPTYIEHADRPYAGATKYSVQFGTKDTFTNWHLVPNSRPVIALPEQKKQMVDIPGGNGVIDLSMSINKYPLFNRRTGTLSFSVIPGYDAETIRQDMAYYLHGQKLNMILSDDPDYYYTGYYSVLWTSNEDGSMPTVEIEYDLEPYKTANEITYISPFTDSNTYTITKTVPSAIANISKTGGTIPRTFPTPLLLTVSGLVNNAAMDILFSNSYLGITMPTASSTTTNYLIKANGNYTITKYPISSRNNSSDTIGIKFSTLQMPSTGSPSLVVSKLGFRRKLL